jgi:hypothetical protein
VLDLAIYRLCEGGEIASQRFGTAIRIPINFVEAYERRDALTKG